jgi:hypothetical protein
MWERIRKFLGLGKDEANTDPIRNCQICGAIVREEDLIIDKFPILYGDSYFLPNWVLSCSNCIKDKDKTLIRANAVGCIISIAKEEDILNSFKNKAILDLRYYR